jgi:hypothetical protein
MAKRGKVKPPPRGVSVSSSQRATPITAAHAGPAGRSPTPTAADGECAHPAHRFLADVLASICFPIYVIDARTYEIVLANQSSYRGTLPPHITCHALTHHRSAPCDDPTSPCPIEEVKTTKHHAVVEHTHHDRYGAARRFEVHAFPIVDRHGCVSHIIEQTIDVTDRRRVEEERLHHQKSLEMLVDALEHSTRELSSFASVAAHDMRSPMAMVSSSAKLL